MNVVDHFSGIIQNDVGVNPLHFDTIIHALNLDIPQQSTLEEQREICFAATINAIQLEEWHKINKISSALIKLQDREHNIFFTLLDEGSEVSLQRLEHILQDDICEKLREAICSEERFQEEALHSTVRLGQEKLVSILATSCIHIDQINSEGKTSLHVAIEEGSQSIVKILLSNNCKKIECKIKGDLLSPLALAVALGKRECFDLLAKEDSLLSDSVNLLSLAIQYGQTEMLEHLLTGYSVDSQQLIKRKEQGKTPFVLAASLNDREAIRLMYQKVNILGRNDVETPLHMAIQGGYHKAVDWLLYLGAEIQHQDIKAATGTMQIKLANVMSKREKEKYSPPDFSSQPPQNLVFKGGGPRGIAYIRALKVLEDKRALREVVRVAGTSAGAVTAALIAVGCNSDMVLNFLDDNPLMDLLDHPFKMGTLETAIRNNITISNLFNFVCNPTNFIKNKMSLNLIPMKIFEMLWNFTGLCKGDVALKGIESQISQSTGIPHCTFGELRKLITEGKNFKHLHVFASKTGGTRPEIFHFSSEDPAWDNLIISDAVLASMSIPGIFQPHTLHFKDHRGVRYSDGHWGSFVDGGLLCNFPLEVFDKRGYIENGLKGEAYDYPCANRRTLGFYVYSSLDDKKEKLIDDKPVKTVLDLFQSICQLYFNAEELVGQKNLFNENRMIKIDCKEVSLTSFNLTKKQQQMLFDSAENATNDFFKAPICEFGSLFSTPTPQKYAVTTGLKSPLQGLSLQRDSLLKSLIPEEKLSKEVNIFTLYGSPGVGKSELACTFANKNRHQFSFIYWIDCATKELKYSSYFEIAKELRVLHLQHERNSVNQLEKNIFHKLTTRKLDKPWLLIFDNAEQEIDFPKFAESGGFILRIAKEKNISANLQSVELFVLKDKEKDAADFLEKYTGCASKEDRQNVKFLAQKLEYFPISLHFAASYIKKKELKSFTSFLDELLQKQCEDLPEIPLSLRKICELALTLIKENYPNAFEWLNVCAHFQPAKIFCETADYWLEQKLSTKVNSQQKKEQVLDILKELSLVREDEKTKSFSLHPYILKYVQGVQKEKSSYYKRAAFTLLLEEGRSLNRKEVGEKQALWLFHMTGILKTTKSRDLGKESCGEAWKLVGEVESFFLNFELSSKAFEKGLKYLKFSEELRSTKIHISDALAGQSNIQRISGDIAGALQKDRDALQKREDLYGRTTNDAKIAESLYQLGLDLKILGEIEEAKSHLEKCLVMRTSLDEQKKPSVASTLIALGMCFQNSGDFSTACERYREALKILKMKSAERAIVLAHIGSVLRSLNQHEAALESYEEAFAIQKELYTLEDHVDPLYGIGLCSLSLNKSDQAIEHFEKAKNIAEEMKPQDFGKKVALCLKGIADAYYQKKNFTDSKKTYLEAIKKYKEATLQINEMDLFLKEANDGFEKAEQAMKEKKTTAQGSTSNNNGSSCLLQ